MRPSLRNKTLNNKWVVGKVNKKIIKKSEFQIQCVILSQDDGRCVSIFIPFEKINYCPWYSSLRKDGRLQANILIVALDAVYLVC